MKLPNISWPTAFVLVAFLLLVGALLWSGRPLNAAAAGALGTLAAAFCKALLQPAPPEKDQVQ